MLSDAAALPALASQAVPAGRPPRLRIREIEGFSIELPLRGLPRHPFKQYRYSLTRVHTDQGITGTSFVPIRSDTLQRWVGPMLRGQDLFAVDDHLRRLQKQRGESGSQLFSGVEHAIWDAIGRAVNLPVAKILGGYRDKLRIYRTCVFPGKPDQSDVPFQRQAEYAAALKKNGFGAMKVRAWRPRPMDDVEMVGVVRQAVGDDFEIMLDRTAVRPGWVWDYATALKVARGLEKHRAYWLEEPFDGYDLEGPARLAAEVDIPITGGELGKTLHQFLGYLTRKTYDIIQPDTRICGGIWNARRVSILAEAFGVPCIQHGTSGAALAGYIQAGCAMPNCEWQEMIGGPVMPQEQWEPLLAVLKTPHLFRIEGGYVHLPELPGLGFDLNEDAIKEYRKRG
jgi:D-galactarolactone cycloisomerase